MPRLLDVKGGAVAAAAGVVAGVATAPLTAAAVPIGLGVAALAYGAALAARAAGRTHSTATALEKGSPADVWQSRALTAIADLHRLVEQAHGLNLLRVVDDGAADTADSVRRLAGQYADVTSALFAVPTARLAEEERRLEDAVRSAGPPELAAEHRRSLDSVREQLAVADRLAAARDTLLARLQSTALGLEGLVARAGEVLAMTRAVPDPAGADRLDGLAADLDALRAGLAETEELSRRALHPEV